MNPNHAVDRATTADADPERHTRHGAAPAVPHRRLLWLLVALTGTVLALVLVWPAECWPLGSSAPTSGAHPDGARGWFSTFGVWLRSIPPWACKGRGLCPSCNARRMAETAAHLVDHVIPPLPVRQ